MRWEFDPNVPECVKNCPAARMFLVAATEADWYKAECDTKIPTDSGLFHCRKFLLINYKRTGLLLTKVAQIKSGDPDEVSACEFKDNQTITNNIDLSKIPRYD